MTGRLPKPDRAAPPSKGTPAISRRGGERWLAAFGRSLPAGEREFVIGDLMEELECREHRQGRRAARRWLLRQLLGLARHRVLTWSRVRGKENEMTITPELPRAVLRDLALGTRLMRRSPRPTLLVVATLAFGIGLTTLVFMLADGILFRSLPYPDPERLVSIQTNSGGSGWYGSSEPELLDLEELPVFEAVGAWILRFAPLDAGERTRRVTVALLNAAMLPSLGVAPALGRLPDERDNMPGAEPVVVASHGFWHRQLGARRDALGQTIHLRGQAHEIIGVMPPGFRFPTAQTELWAPLGLDRQNPWGRNNHYLNVIARLRPDIGVREARAAVDTLAARSVAAYPEFYGENGYRTLILDLQQAVTGNERRPMWVMLGAVGLLLLLTCANLANMQLGRGALRARELAVRRSLGASRGRLIGQLMAESIVLAGSGAAAAVAVVLLGERLLPRVLPPELLRFGAPALDLRVLAFTLGATFLTALAFGLWPALRATRRPSGGSPAGAAADVSMTDLARGGGRTRWLRSGLVVGQVALATVLLIGCGMLVRSLQRMVEIDPGFDAEGVLVIESLPPEVVFDSPEKRVDHYRAVDQLLLGMPGVVAAGGMARLPLSGLGNTWSIEIEDQPAATLADAPAALVQQVTPGLFEALAIPLLQGRFFDARDTADTELVVIVNQAFAEEFWPGEEALGKRLRVYDQEAPWMRVVGVVETVRDGRLDLAGRSQWYVPHAQAYRSAWASPRDMALVMKTTLDSPIDLAPQVLARLRELDDRVTYVDPSSLLSVLARSLALPRQMAVWVAIFAAIATGLAALGLYGVLSYMVMVRRSEIGIRLALGAAPRTILGSVLGEGFVLCSIGLVFGIAGGLAFSQAAESILFEARLADPAVIAAALLILLAIGSLAPLAPAWRASRTDPCQALRGE